jgi:hypothetical protein
MMLEANTSRRTRPTPRRAKRSVSATFTSSQRFAGARMGDPDEVHHDFGSDQITFPAGPPKITGSGVEILLCA